MHTSFLFFLLLPFAAFSQSMKSIFLQLPAECIPDLNKKQKELLLKKTVYELPGGDAEERIQYTLDTPVLKNYLLLGYEYLSGQNGFQDFELKKISLSKANDLVIFSRYGGVKTMFTQDTLKVFNLINGKLIEYKNQHFFPQDIPFTLFLKTKTPKSIQKRIEGYACTSYNLNRDKPDIIEFKLYTPFMPEELEKWLLGDTFVFSWDGKSFKRKLIFWKQLANTSKP